MTWYDARNIRLRVHGHELGLATRPYELLHGGIRDRFAIGVETHELKKTKVDGKDFVIGGVRDTVLHVAYGMEHPFARRFRFAWQEQFRHAWLGHNRQRHLRSSVALVFVPATGHELRADVVAFVIFRDRNQQGNPLPQGSTIWQGGLRYAWMSRSNVGFMVHARAMSSFLSGESPMFEIREESLNAKYGELIGGIVAYLP